MSDIGSASQSLIRSTGQKSSADVETYRLPAWPVLVLLWGYPVFWMLGILPSRRSSWPCRCWPSSLCGAASCSSPASSLGRLHALDDPASLMVDQLGRLIGIGVRFSQFLALAIMIVYVVNARASLPRSVY
ncbi:hypothetical protein [Microbacterium sp. NIBRBAC000506063]|uniref:hypothetical protein n=1 Tax=Microbacterium sp. NIBRBAC000506063 TaxID=2734618 RepID=UPI001BB522E0|nr:hypothetical protein [Microbacterium sp. NIBRBAC000506063]QTV80190.1 hypothetical protein KAE78_03885 [Microbacterium sp. NIBRBAC000506063]